MGDKFSITGSPIVKSMSFHRIISRSTVFYRISPISMNLTPKTRKHIFSKSLFVKKVGPIDLWFFPTQKYGSKGHGKIAQTGFIAVLRFLIEKLLFLLTKIPGTLYSPISGSETSNQRCTSHSGGVYLDYQG